MWRLSQIGNKKHHAELQFLPSSPKRPPYDLKFLITLSYCLLFFWENWDWMWEFTVRKQLWVVLSSTTKLLTESWFTETSYKSPSREGTMGACGWLAEHPLMSPIMTLDTFIYWHGNLFSEKDHITEQYVPFDLICYYKNILVYVLIA